MRVKVIKITFVLWEGGKGGWVGRATCRGVELCVSVSLSDERSDD